MTPRILTYKISDDGNDIFKKVSDDADRRQRPGPDLAMWGPWALFIAGALIEQAWLSSTQDGC